MDCLIKAGANVNVRDANGATPVLRAVAERKIEAIIHLVQNGAYVCTRSRELLKTSALHVAYQYVQNRDLEVINRIEYNIIEARANLNVLDFARFLFFSLLLLLLLLVCLHGPFSLALASLRIANHSFLSCALILHRFIPRAFISASTSSNHLSLGLQFPFHFEM
jgi:hypothetical protein